MITLHLHPLASYCWKVLIGLYETDTAFVPNVVDLSDPAQRAALMRLSPLGKFPVLEDGGRAITESTTILEHVGGALIPPAIASDVRAKDRFFDLYVHEPMQKIVGERLRPVDGKDPLGVAQARATLATAYDMIEHAMSDRAWAAGASFTMADCAAAPALYYANEVAPIDELHPRTRAYLDRLKARPSVARVMREAAPYAHMFPR